MIQKMRHQLIHFVRIWGFFFLKHLVCIKLFFSTHEYIPCLKVRMVEIYSVLIYQHGINTAAFPFLRTRHKLSKQCEGVANEKLCC